MMMLQSSLLFGENVEGSDRYGDWRLDVDHMSYEVCGFLPLTWIGFATSFSHTYLQLLKYESSFSILGLGSRNYWI